MNLYPHHLSTIENIKNAFIGDESILAIGLGGSIAHGYAKAESDVDIIFVLTDGEFYRREQNDTLLYFDRGLCTYPRGYIDGKSVNRKYLEMVNEKGNEPTRYAFKDMLFIFCKDDEIKTIIRQIPVFDLSIQAEHAKKFYAQLLAWKWFYSEGVKHDNQYLVNTAVANFSLYACRLILNHNGLLYPYHKWMMKEVEKAEIKPIGFLDNIEKLQESRSTHLIELIFEDIKRMEICEFDEARWSVHFYKDVETTWMIHEPCVSDV